MVWQSAVSNLLSHYLAACVNTCSKWRSKGTRAVIARVSAAQLTATPLIAMRTLAIDEVTLVPRENRTHQWPILGYNSSRLFDTAPTLHRWVPGCRCTIVKEATRWMKRPESLCGVCGISPTGTAADKRSKCASACMQCERGPTL